MTPERFRIVKHLTAALFALAMAGLFVLGVDGLIGGVQRLTHIYLPSRPAPAASPAEATPPAATATEPGVIAAFVVPPADAGTPTGAGSASGSSGR